MKLGCYDFEKLSSKKGHNRSLSYINTILSLVDEFQNYNNLADLLNNLLQNKSIEQNQIASIVYMFLVEKYSYINRSYNFCTTFNSLEAIHNEVSTWGAVDIVITYFNREKGFSIFNPKNPNHWDYVGTFNRSDFITIFAGAFQESQDKKVLDTAINQILGFFEGKNISGSVLLKKGKYNFLAMKGGISSIGKKNINSSAREKADKSLIDNSLVNKRKTPLYSIPVTNELFHNGNVEAWKIIIESYTKKYPKLNVVIFYEGEKILDINVLYQWGKVKHGRSIFFSIEGEYIRDVSKLHRYLRHGASSNFKDFLYKQDLF